MTTTTTKGDTTSTTTQAAPTIRTIFRSGFTARLTIAVPIVIFPY